MIRAGRGGAYAADWLDRNVIGIGWDFDGADIANMSREQIKAAYVSAHPTENKQRVAASVGQVYRFAHSMAKAPQSGRRRISGNHLRQRHRAHQGPRHPTRLGGHGTPCGESPQSHGLLRSRHAQGTRRRSLHSPAHTHLVAGVDSLMIYYNWKLL